MKEQKKSDYYDILRKKEWRNTADFGPSIRARYKILVGLAKQYGKKDGFILDCGCGEGNLLKLLVRQGFNNLSGSDFSDEAIKLTKDKFKGLLYKIDLTQKKDFQNKKYDLIICSEVLEHIQNDRLAIRNLYNVLNKNGILILSVPFSLGYWSKHDDFSGHVRRYENNELEEKLKTENFHILESFGWGNIIYPLYYRLLTKIDPSTVMNNKRGVLKFIKVIVSKILFYVFFLEEISKSKKRARRIFIIANK